MKRDKLLGCKLYRITSKDDLIYNIYNSGEFTFIKKISRRDLCDILSVGQATKLHKGRRTEGNVRLTINQQKLFNI